MTTSAMKKGNNKDSNTAIKWLSFLLRIQKDLASGVAPNSSRSHLNVFVFLELPMHFPEQLTQFGSGRFLLHVLQMVIQRSFHHSGL
jgi:hypothetical protein